ncbi:hypothetical protein AUJ95_04075 [Candidatus Desantisbacteria bacterium CG2_30_40_21]|uniref:PorV/PorQ family protein n=5 Tax=unclassified Candidatus Desantisiibacteriota TaxID=3106372 RepID=A0A2M7JBR9_9BACT|nr:MAG: hypothetical protein AUJ95_04075 [Candidatus Desantisbacteria bacterium CG2_30_40_21]PIP40420.1 MAG: hypothetical protein COX18_06790 [Candidatus Desantisbacteria bacterium CG23_combo_of_CG06-09_8_20_14_all_40_23]PIX16846.1 MAG: hypothetical protein COZ71_06440 [Candidatus Desantisbacteria bacterium CG_4_8_14_3_um_filter_40_12]PIY18605.1 MAG: hypothetical protein COZ13_09710 [Candidatus Desantisbacteria bacterium CG_4_10_14_3_um_filter_40_18]PJB29454.1 MAG: hypothetical protein CO110_05
MKKKIITLLCLLICQSSLVYGELLVKPKGVDILRISPDPRGSSMGKTGVGFSGVSVTGIYWNPASIAGIDKRELAFMHNQWLNDIKYEFIGYSLPLEDRTAYLGISTAYLHMDKIPGRYITRLPMVDYSAYDLISTIVYTRVYQYFGYGATVKLISSKIENETAKGMGLDVGAIYNLDNELGLGISMNNIGLKRSKFIDHKDSLPLSLRIGGYYKNRHRLLTCLELIKELDRNVNLGCGVEYEVLKNNQNKNLYLRMGYNTNKNEKITAGIGITHSSLKLDYCYEPYNTYLGDTHRILLNYTTQTPSLPHSSRPEGGQF